MATNLVPGDTNGTWDVFLRDRAAGATSRVSVDSAGTEGNNRSGPGMGLWLSVSAGARLLAFESLASNLVPEDRNSNWPTP